MKWLFTDNLRLKHIRCHVPCSHRPNNSRRRPSSFGSRDGEYFNRAKNVRQIPRYISFGVVPSYGMTRVIERRLPVWSAYPFYFRQSGLSRYQELEGESGIIGFLSLRSIQNH